MTYTDEQIEAMAKSYGDLAVARMLRAWIAERNRKLVVTDDMLAAAIYAYDNAIYAYDNESNYPHRSPIFACIRAAIEAALKEMQK